MNEPKVSVVMPVYNGEAYLRKAIDSILAQTFVDFELVVINDGSTDASVSIIESYHEDRIRLYNNAQNSGLAAVRNRGIREARGEFIAWLDCDDISLPNRLLKQVTLLDTNPNLGLCGTWVRTLGLNPEQVWCYPTDPGFVRGRMLFDDPIATSAAMMRRSCLGANELRFDTQFPPAEDYDLWERISRANGVCNIPEVHTLYRIHPHQISKIKREQQQKAVWAIQSRLLQQLQIEPSDKEKSLHLEIGVGWHFVADQERIALTEDWLFKLAHANDRSHVFPLSGFRRVLAERWFLAIQAAVREGKASWRQYGKSILSTWEPLRLRRQARLLWQSVHRGK